MLQPSTFRLSGRNTWHGDVLYLGWSGCFLEFETDASRVDIRLRTDDPVMDRDHQGRVAVFAGNTVVPVRTLMLETPETVLSVPTRTSPGGRKITFRIMKLSEAAFGLTGICDITVDEGAVMFPTAGPRRRIEFVGDSITCGYGVEATGRDTFSTATENPLKAYAYYVCQACSAEWEVVAWSGNGVYSCWVPDGTLLPNADFLMTRQYPFRNLRMDARLGLESPLHDFVSRPVDLVVLNLGTNDASYVKSETDRTALFRDLYLGMVDEIHYFRPGTPILCTLGTLSQTLCGVEESVVDTFRSFYPKSPITFVKLPLQESADGLGADGHPSLRTQMKTARILSEAIRTFMNW